MASDELDETTQIVEGETQDVETQKPSEDVPATVDSEGKKKAAKKERKERKEPVELVREPGKSLFPFSRVQKIVRADQVWNGEYSKISTRIDLNRTYQ